MTDWQPWTRPLAVNIAITGTSIRLDFPAGRYLVAQPVVREITNRGVNMAVGTPIM